MRFLFGRQMLLLFSQRPVPVFVDAFAEAFFETLAKVLLRLFSVILPVFPAFSLKFPTQL